MVTLNEMFRSCLDLGHADLCYMLLTKEGLEKPLALRDALMTRHPRGLKFALRLLAMKVRFPEDFIRLNHLRWMVNRRHFAARARILQRAGVNWHITDSAQMPETILHKMVEFEERRFKPVLTAFVKYKVDLNPRNALGETPLILAASKGYDSKVWGFIRAGALLDAQDNEGRTALYRAAKNGHAGTCVQLGAAGADVLIADNKGLTPFNIAGANKHTEVLPRLTHVMAGPRPFS